MPPQRDGWFRMVGCCTPPAAPVQPDAPLPVQRKKYERSVSGTCGPPGLPRGLDLAHDQGAHLGPMPVDERDHRPTDTENQRVQRAWRRGMLPDARDRFRAPPDGITSLKSARAGLHGYKDACHSPDSRDSPQWAGPSNPLRRWPKPYLPARARIRLRHVSLSCSISCRVAFGGCIRHACLPVITS